MPDFASSSPLNALTAMAVSCRPASLFSAVTIISSSMKPSALLEVAIVLMGIAQAIARLNAVGENFIVSFPLGAD